MKEVLQDLNELFAEARKRSEFEFVLVLINYRGLGTHKLTTNLYEWFEAIESYKNLLDSLSGKDKTRIAMLLYSTFFENSDFYNIIGSLCRVKLGFRGSSYLFWKTKKNERLIGVNEKQDFLLDLIFDADKKHIIQFFERCHNKNIRNAFFHSAYSLDINEVILHESELPSFEISPWFYSIVDDIYKFFCDFKRLFLESFMLFTSDKEITTTTTGFEKITILGNSQGLQGFKHKNAVQFYGIWYDSGIWYEPKSDMWEGHNIRIFSENLETIQIREQLERYEQKDEIRLSDADFFNLIDKIVERRAEVEIARATSLLLKFGNNKKAKMVNEVNPYKQKGYAKVILPFYYKAIEIGSKYFDASALKKQIESIEQFQKSN